MAASPNVPHSSAFSKSPISKNGVLTIQGYGIRIRMQSGHLEIEGWYRPRQAKHQACPRSPRSQAIGVCLRGWLYNS